MKYLKWSKLYFWTLIQSGKEKGITKGRVISYAAQIAEGMMFLHSKVSYHWAIEANRSLNRNFWPTSKEKYRQNKGVKLSRGQWIGWQSQKLDSRFRIVSSLDMISGRVQWHFYSRLLAFRYLVCDVIIRVKGPCHLFLYVLWRPTGQLPCKISENCLITYRKSPAAYSYC